eukprot:6199066-Pleurochrysis_carterae.AAC.1
MFMLMVSSGCYVVVRRRNRQPPAFQLRVASVAFCVLSEVSSRMRAFQVLVRTTALLGESVPSHGLPCKDPLLCLSVGSLLQLRSNSTPSTGAND